MIGLTLYCKRKAGLSVPLFSIYGRITRFGFFFRLCLPSTNRTVPDFARMTRLSVVPTEPLN